jgi:AraC family transcriptional regulator
MASTRTQAVQDTAQSRPKAHERVNPLSPQQLERALRFIDRELSRVLRLDDVARQVHLSRFQFSRKFSVSTGSSFTAYLTQRRVAIARARLIENTRMSMTHLALDLGFCDQAHFSNCFRKETGYSPREFLKQCVAREKMMPVRAIRGGRELQAVDTCLVDGAHRPKSLAHAL